VTGETTSGGVAPGPDRLMVRRAQLALASEVDQGAPWVRQGMHQWLAQTDQENEAKGADER
jgi:hypothetical protein